MASKKVRKGLERRSTPSTRRGSRDLAKGDRPSLLSALQKEFGSAAGETDLFHLVDVGHDGRMIERCRKVHGLELIGRSHDGLCYFGTAARSTEPMVELRPIVEVDNKGTDPTTAAKNLADYLSLCAYAISFGRTAAEWRACERESRQDNDFLELRERLCALPGVTLPAKPWLLQRDLPPFDSSASSAERPLEARVKELFERDLSRLKLLLLLDEVVAAEGKTVLRVLVDGPSELAEVLPSQPFVHDALRAHLTNLRDAFPTRHFKVEILYDTLSDESLSGHARSRESWRRLSLAMKLAGQEALYDELLRRSTQAR